ncbi:hypothetical protein FAZ19_07350 [Sphingobacterium alkalisoli]|uniref:IPT/TIG domain-containing protein n=2 Tax=Sphingobacterium TaxID=28453 RepID=A0A4U0NK70_9SPHI|nr:MULTISPECIES: IPT/TIG domain-containing protein [Sphingobacterium]TJY66727.1 hypothetical protein FAZ19_07350 [Sphingobacterium alkalisoli]TJZ54735.1 hypothetical protein FAZ15_14735 [Sphingobacterium olei]
MRILLYIIPSICVLLSSCRKVENIMQAEETKPIVLEAAILEHLDAKSARLSCRITSLNNEIVKEHGIILYSGMFPNVKEEQVSIGGKVEIGKISYNYTRSVPFEIGKNYMVSFYVQTEKSFYRSGLVSFKWNNVQVNPQNDLSATTGETITITGNFEGIDEKFIITDWNTNTTTPFTLSSDKKSLSFVVPKTNIPHGSILNFNLSKRTTEGGNEFSTIALCRVKVLASINPPEISQLYLSDAIPLKGNNLPSMYEIPADLMLIIGDQKIRYQNPLRLTSIEGLKGNNLKIGYSNGRDEIIFPEPIRLIIPNKNDIRFNEKVVHPGSQLRLQGLEFAKFFNYGSTSFKVGGAPLTQPINPFPYNLDIIVPQVADGHHAVEIISPFYNGIVSTEKIEVKELKLSGPSQVNAHVGNTIQIKGSFINGKIYEVHIAGHTIYNIIAQNGEISFEVPNLKSGKNEVKISYRHESWDSHFSTSPFTVFVEKSMINSVSPLVAYPGDVITVTGRGLNTGSSYTLGGHYINVVNKTADGFKFLIPSGFQKGKARLTIEINDDIIQSDDYIEVK